MKTTKSVKTSAQTTSQLILKCRNCNKKFFSNNKLHRHIRSFHRAEEVSQKILKIASVNIIALIQIIDSTNKAENYRGFAFRSHRYAIVKDSLVLKSTEQKLCMNSETFMSLVDRAFLTKQLFHIVRHKTTSSIKIRGIESAIHDNSEYVILDLYMSGKYQENSATAHFKTEFHIVNDVKTNMLIEMNVMKSERINLDFENKIMIISTCRDIQVSINFHRKEISVNRTVRAATQITMSVEKTIAVSMRIKGAQIPKNRDYSFFSKMKRMLESEKEYFAHVTNFNLVAIQVRNTSDRSYTISKNFKIEHLRDFDEKNCFMASPEDSHLAVASSQTIDVRKALKSENFMKITLANEITVYGDETIVRKLQAITEKTSEV